MIASPTIVAHASGSDTSHASGTARELADTITRCKSIAKILFLSSVRRETKTRHYESNYPVDYRREDHNFDWLGSINMTVRSTARLRLSSSDPSFVAINWKFVLRKRPRPTKSRRGLFCCTAC